eukprot:1458202-Rhodomonas_salina.6
MLLPERRHGGNDAQRSQTEDNVPGSPSSALDGRAVLGTGIPASGQNPASRLEADEHFRVAEQLSENW